MVKLMILVVIIVVYTATKADGACRSVSCDSKGFRYNRCKVPGSRYVSSVTVENKRSKSACIHGQSFGRYIGDIWVDDGCRATFRVCYIPGRSQDITCDSVNYKRKNCFIGPNSTHLTLLSHKSKSPCIPGHSYGRNRSHLYVDHGCRAVFRVYYSS